MIQYAIQLNKFHYQQQIFQRLSIILKYEFLTTLITKSTVFQDVTLCSFVKEF
jgi:hypothetical protein